MKKRYLTIPLLLSPLAVLSCSNNTATTEQKVEIEKSDPNTNFVNKISSNTGYKQLETSFSPVKTENRLFLTISPVLKVLASTKIMPNDLPSEVTILEILDNKQNFKSASVTWEVPEEGIVAIADTEISGTATFKNQKTPVKAIIKTQLLRFEKKGEFITKEEGLSVDEAKSTVNKSNNQPLRNLIDRTGDYGATASRWDNWGTDTKEPILYSKANEISEFKVGSTTIETTKDNLDYEMMVDDLDAPLSIKTNATQTKRYLIDKDDKKTFKTYKIISYNDLGQFKVYNLVLRKKGN